MVIVSNSSPLITLSRINHLFILKSVFGYIYIPESVFQETVRQSTSPVQRHNLLQVIDDYIFVAHSTTVYTFKRKLDSGEQGVLNLALEKHADVLLIDDKKAINEAKELGFKTVKTSAVLEQAEKLGIIESCSDIIKQLEKINIYLSR